ncbi:MAG TPA: peptidoglycan-binding domain-containing protein [Burkholderiales bacterium]|nr:peptidoglycan-binding domain-containing protein [Burkholderiales bacterium]
MSLHRHAFALLLLIPLSTLGAGAFTSIHPEEAYPDPAQGGSSDPYTGFITGVQEKLRELGFDAGPANGDFGPKTQTALGQFQLSRDIPASGQLDDATLAELGMTREAAQASTGATAEPSASPDEKKESDAAPKPGG